jgi:hypothetical protein
MRLRTGDCVWTKATTPSTDSFPREVGQPIFRGEANALGENPGAFSFQAFAKGDPSIRLGARVVPCQRDFRFGRGGNSEVISDRQQRYGFAFRPVRAAVPWRMPMSGARCPSQRRR